VIYGIHSTGLKKGGASCLVDTRLLLKEVFMRKDMKHVIIDRPRVGGDGGKSILPKGSKKRLQQTPWEDQPKHESTAPRRLYGYFCKELNEHLSPLRRWLHDQVGRDWDEVWSEICDGLSVRNATTAHVRDHADRYVEKNCFINNDGKVCDSRGITLNSDWGWKQFYVNPRDNTLQVAPDYRTYRKNRKKKDWVAGKDENHRCYLFDGIWYEVELKPFSEYQKTMISGDNRVYDIVIASQWKARNKNDGYYGSTEKDLIQFYKKAVYAASKRQLGKREIHKLKLWDTEVGQQGKE
jgi:hypothetical protein